MGREDEEARPVEQRVRIGEETEMKRMWELAVCEEVSEELAEGKRIPGSIHGGQDWCDQGWVKTELEVHASAKRCLREHHHLQRCIWSCVILRLKVMYGALMCGQYL